MRSSQREELAGDRAVSGRDRRHARTGRLFAAAVPAVLRRDRSRRHHATRERGHRGHRQADGDGAVRQQCRARPAVALRAGAARGEGASRRAEAGLFLRREHWRSADRRARDVQCHAAADRHLFQQNPMFLLHRGAARTASESRYAGGVLRRSGLRQGSRAAEHRHDHVGLYFFPLGQSRKRHRSVALSARCAAGRRPRPGTVQRALHRLPRARRQQVRPDARRRRRPQGRRGPRLPLFAGARERELCLVGREPRSVAHRSAAIRSRRENAGSRSGADLAPRHHCLSAAGKRRPDQNHRTAASTDSSNKRFMPPCCREQRGRVISGVPNARRSARRPS